MAILSPLAQGGLRWRMGGFRYIDTQIHRYTDMLALRMFCSHCVLLSSLTYAPAPTPLNHKLHTTHHFNRYCSGLHVTPVSNLTSASLLAPAGLLELATLSFLQSSFSCPLRPLLRLALFNDAGKSRSKSRI